jgi:hypothetical protein
MLKNYYGIDSCIRLKSLHFEFVAGFEFKLKDKNG